MSLATELERIATARDSIRNNLLGVGLGTVETKSVLEEGTITVDYNTGDGVDEYTGNETYLNTDGNGSVSYETTDATFTIKTTYKGGDYAIAFTGTEYGASLSLNGHSVFYDPEYDGDAGGYLHTYTLTEEIASNWGIYTGAELTFVFSGMGAGSTNKVTISITYEAEPAITEDSKLDECADALDNYLSEVSTALDEV